MRSRCTTSFWNRFRQLPAETQRAARKAYRLFRRDPHHPSLQFKHIRNQIYSARINVRYRALGIMEEGDLIVWYWIGTHAEYEKLLRKS